GGRLHFAADVFDILLNLRRWNEEADDPRQAEKWRRRAVRYVVVDPATGTESIDVEATCFTSSWSTTAACPVFALSCESSMPTTSTWRPAASAVTICASSPCWS